MQALKLPARVAPFPFGSRRAQRAIASKFPPPIRAEACNAGRQRRAPTARDRHHSEGARRRCLGRGKKEKSLSMDAPGCFVAKTSSARLGGQQRSTDRQRIGQIGCNLAQCGNLFLFNSIELRRPVRMSDAASAAAPCGGSWVPGCVQRADTTLLWHRHSLLL
ncbi:hypothetical protein BDY21DRAFT_65574 [Lineolata rhizophorae]|uniref:Uncharacterized protein n=1 Tax=Lineolata rhizophorae TaxID=578093 RepID=A0A6A6NWR1_9PEZI|nr:hypothetical protein BDY21DRAFT_65574 [Lineolata rhizophorae]